jgi:hypothetical protein
LHNFVFLVVIKLELFGLIVLYNPSCDVKPYALLLAAFSDILVVILVSLLL